MSIFRFVIFKGGFMAIDKQYISKHQAEMFYVKQKNENGFQVFNNRNKWVDNIIDENMICSHRKTKYTKKIFPKACTLTNTTSLLYI